MGRGSNPILMHSCNHQLTFRARVSPSLVLTDRGTSRLEERGNHEDQTRSRLASLSCRRYHRDLGQDPARSPSSTRGRAAPRGFEGPLASRKAVWSRDRKLSHRLEPRGNRLGPLAGSVLVAVRDLRTGYYPARTFCGALPPSVGQVRAGNCAPGGTAIAGAHYGTLTQAANPLYGSDCQTILATLWEHVA